MIGAPLPHLLNALMENRCLSLPLPSGDRMLGAWDRQAWFLARIQESQPGTGYSDAAQNDLAPDTACDCPTNPSGSITERLSACRSSWSAELTCFCKSHLFITFSPDLFSVLSVLHRISRERIQRETSRGSRVHSAFHALSCSPGGASLITPRLKRRTAFNDRESCHDRSGSPSNGGCRLPTRRICSGHSDHQQTKDIVSCESS
jgi:hypothetical protein